MLYPISILSLTAKDLRDIRSNLSADKVMRPTTKVFYRGLVAALITHAHLRDIWGWGAYSYAIARATRAPASRQTYSLYTRGPDGQPVAVETTDDLGVLIAALDQYAAADPQVDLWTTDDTTGLVRVYMRGKRS